MSICDTICQAIGDEPRLAKPLTQNSQSKLLHEMSLLGLTQNDPNLTELQKQAFRAQMFFRKSALKYVLSGLRQSSELYFSQNRQAYHNTDKSSLRHVVIPTYRITENSLGNEFGKEITHTERKLELQYGSWDQPLVTYCDFLLQHNDKQYFGLVMRGLQDYQKNRFLLLDKIGSDLFEDTYNGFVIFAPLDDPSVKLHVESDVALSAPELDSIIAEHNLQKSPNSVNMRKLNKIISKQQYQEANIHYKPNTKNKKVKRILKDFPQTSHIIGLPYNISLRDEYFLDIATIYGIERKK